ncbi:MAG: signal recognition particle-docking protein FtsY [Christensenellaceae bacterium]|jgi:fused signal recognition particle receptor|nr:signal recognition particle-docking protein FtsY [Christensenellaceae bacterium]
MSEEKTKGLFSRLREGMRKTRGSLTGAIDQITGYYKALDDEFYDDLEAILLGTDVGAKAGASIIAELKETVRQRRVNEPAAVKGLLRELVAARMAGEPFRPQTPCAILIVGVNGVGKTTQIGKLACLYRGEGKSVLLAAGDTFRAAAAEQLGIWAERAKVPIVSHQAGADPAAVVFDAVSAAKARGVDITLIDTAGRLHNKAHLMEELKKLRRVLEREGVNLALYTLLVLDGTTGQNGVQQARVFQEAARLDGIILTKLDGTAKGGVVLAIREELGLPVYFIGVGEQIEDLQPFSAEGYAQAIL